MNRQKAYFSMTKWRASLIIMSLSIFALTSMSNRQQTSTTNFQTRVEGFVKKYSTHFTTSIDNIDVKGQQYTLDTRTKPTWTKKVTLRSKTSFVNNYRQTVYQRLNLSFYQYDTNAKCTAALDSLLNCFGGECCKLNWGDSAQSAKSIPCIYIINETEIVACHINCEHQNDFWTKFKHDLEMTFRDGASAIIESGCGGSINFRKY